MKIKTAEATGLALDWGVAVVLGAKKIIVNYRGVWVEDDGFKVGDDCRGWVCHTDPAVCMGLIKEYRMDIDQVERYPYVWIGAYFSDESFEDKDSAGYVAETLEMAVARCVIAMRLGEEFECPSELGVMS